MNTQILELPFLPIEHKAELPKLALYEQMTQDKLFVQSPVFTRVKLLIEAVLDGAIELKGGAYIV